MGSKIKFYEKNYLDVDNTLASITATDDEIGSDAGNAYINNLRDRKNTSSWSTIESDTNATTVLTATFQDYKTLDTIILIKHNFEDYTVDYNDGINWVLYTTVTGNTTITQELSLTEVQANAVRITITKSRDDAFTGISAGDRYLYQFIATKQASENELESFPEIKNSSHKNINKINRSLSGKVVPVFKEPTFKVNLELKVFTSQNDFNFFDNLFNLRRSYLMSLSGFEETQFSMLIRGYRNEDVKLMRLVNDYSPAFYKSIYTSGGVIKLSFEESLD